MNELLYFPESLVLAFLLLVLLSGVYLTIKFLPILPLGFLFKFPLVAKSLVGNLDPGPAGMRLSPGRAWVLGSAYDSIVGAGLGAVFAHAVAGPGALVWIIVVSALVGSVTFAIATVARTVAAGGVTLQLYYALSGIAIPLVVLVLVSQKLAFAYAFLGVGLIFWIGRGGIPRAGIFARYSYVIAVIALLAGAVQLALGVGFAVPIAMNPAEIALLAVPSGMPEFFRMVTATGVFFILSGAGSLRVLSYATLNAAPVSPLASARVGLAFVFGPLISALIAVAVFAALATGDAVAILSRPEDYWLLWTGVIVLSLCGLVGAYMGSEIGAESEVRHGIAAAQDSAYGYRFTNRGRLRAILWSAGAFVWLGALYLGDETSVLPALVLPLTIYVTIGLGAAAAIAAILYAYFRANFATRALREIKNDPDWRPQFGRDLQLLLFHLLPTNLVSRLFGHIAELKLPKALLHPLLRWYAKTFRVNLDEAGKPLEEYESLNLFFTRELKPGLRPIDGRKAGVVSPVDGVLSRFGPIENGTLIQAKGLDYRLEDLLAGSEFVSQFEGGHYAVIYLSPRDYHRIHSQLGGTILGYDYVPGRLFPVNLLAVNGIRDLFPKNERLTTYIQNEDGLTALVKVGATNVGKITVVYDSAVQANRWFRQGALHRYRDHERVSVERGGELARFEMGSTVVLLFERGRFQFSDRVHEDMTVQLGEWIGTMRG
ncbi:MAG: archaetidylserine decarboxylase [bacterium]|nr:archaetidylserine decarboxylase [bacterium]